MDISIGLILGQIVVLALLAVIAYLIALVPLSLKKIAVALTEIRDELRADKTDE